MYALGEYETLASLQYQPADAAHGKQALLDLLDFMRRLDNEQGNAIGNAVDTDRGITYIRLALLEEKEGNHEGSSEYIRKAEESLRGHPGRTMSEAELRASVAKLDSRSRYALPAVFILRQAQR
jgi:hypothetical protein